MNAAHLHLLLNHLPLIGALAGGLLLGWGLLRDSDEVVRAALGTLVLSGAAAVGVYFTGEPAEELVEGLTGVSEAALEAHEEIALWAAILGGGMAVLAAVTLLIHRSREVTARWSVATLAATVAALGVMSWTANQGGQIRHAEIRSDAPAAAPAGAGEEEAEEAEEEHTEARGPGVDGRGSPASTGTGRVAG